MRGEDKEYGERYKGARIGDNDGRVSCLMPPSTHSYEELLWAGVGYKSGAPGCSELDISYFPNFEALPPVHTRHKLERASLTSNIYERSLSVPFFMFVWFHSRGVFLRLPR